MSVSPNYFFYANVNYVDISNVLSNYMNLTHNTNNSLDLSENTLSKYARGIFFSPNYNKQFFDAINWANSLGDYKTQLNLINPYNDNILENLQNNTVSNQPILKYPTWIDDTYIPTFGQSSPISQEGYTIKASSEWHGWSGIYEKWQPFYMTVDKLTTSSDAGWLSVDNTINSNGYANNSNMLSGIDQNTSTNNVTTRNGPWLQLSLPNTIKLTTVDMYSRHERDRIIEGYFYGSNDETTWYELVEISSASDNLSGYDNTSKNTVTINSNVEYKHYIYQVTRAMKKYGSVKKLDYYGY